jgi:hypothetical protein
MSSERVRVACRVRPRLAHERSDDGQFEDVVSVEPELVGLPRAPLPGGRLVYTRNRTAAINRTCKCVPQHRRRFRRRTSCVHKDCGHGTIQGSIQGTNTKNAMKECQP